jgi:hypothetical protein
MNHPATAAHSAEDALRATLSAEQLALFDTYEQTSADEWLRERDELVDGLCRFLPGLEPAVRAYLAIHTGCQPLLSPASPGKMASERLKATLTPEQRQLWLEADSERGDAACDREVFLFEELARHLPAVAPAIRALSGHIFEQKLSDVGKCCELPL